MIKIAEDFVKIFGLDVKIVEWNGALGNYDKVNDVINLNIREIIRYQKKMRKKLSYASSLIEFIKIIVCHELGHRDDKEEIKPFSELINETPNEYFLVEQFAKEYMTKFVIACLKNEKNAWELGKKYVAANKIDEYDKFNEEYIDDRKRDYEERISSLIESKNNGFKERLKNEMIREQMSNNEAP